MLECDALLPSVFSLWRVESLQNAGTLRDAVGCFVLYLLSLWGAVVVSVMAMTVLTVIVCCVIG